jgi:hypothetical protein
MTSPKTPEESYLHERIDQLIRQVGIEIGILDAKSRDSTQFSEKAYELAKKRIWAADDSAADNHRRPHRER